MNPHTNPAPRREMSCSLPLLGSVARLRFGYFVCFTLLTFILISGSRVAAQETTKIYVKIDRSEDPADFITGEVTDQGFENWIKAVGVDQSIEAIPSPSPDGQPIPKLGDFSILKRVDRSTSKLLLAFQEKRTFAKVTIVQRLEKAGDISRQPVRVELQDVLLSGFQFSTGPTGDDFRPVDPDAVSSVELTLTYHRVRWVYTPSSDPALPDPSPVTFEIDTQFGSGNAALDSDLDGTFNDLDLDDDNDGIPDRYELRFGLDPLHDDSLEDLDEDGQSNLQEFIAGTGANNAQSFFGIESIAVDVADPTQALLTVRPRTGRQYRLMGSPDGLNWMEIRRFNGPENANVVTREVAAPSMKSSASFAWKFS